jgi:poly(3-hydroxybutyrate) depolymerase
MALDFMQGQKDRAMDGIKIFVLALLLAAAPTSALRAADDGRLTSIPTGRGEIQLHFGKISLKVFTYRPKNFDRANGPMLLIFHGHSRDADRYRNSAEDVAKHCRGLVIAPLFDEEQFPGGKYIHGNVMSKGKMLPESKWTFSLVPKIIEDVRKIEGRPDMPYYLWGHSGGGQFVSRLIAFVKLNPIEAVVANPGVPFFPTRDMPYPYGFGKLPDSIGDKEQIKAYLACRLTMYAGTADTDPNHAELDKSAEAEKQGPNRLARARNDFRLGNEVAKSENCVCNWRYIEAPGVAHSAGKMLRNPRCIEALFGRSYVPRNPRTIGATRLTTLFPDMLGD